MGGSQPYQLICEGGSTDGPRGHKASYRNGDTAIGNARQAVASRTVRAPQSHVLVLDKLTGDIIFSWYGPDSGVPLADRRRVTRDYYESPVIASPQELQHQRIEQVEQELERAASAISRACDLMRDVRSANYGEGSLSEPMIARLARLQEKARELHGS